MGCGASENREHEVTSSGDDGLHGQLLRCSPVASRPPPLPLEADHAGGAEVAASCDVTGDSMFTKDLERTSQPHTEPRISL